MAISLFNYTLLAPPRLSASFSSKPSITLETKTPSPLHQMPLRQCKPINASLLSSSSPIPINNIKRRSLKTYLAPEDSAPTVCCIFFFLFNFFFFFYHFPITCIHGNKQPRSQDFSYSILFSIRTNTSFISNHYVMFSMWCFLFLPFFAIFAITTLI